MYLFYRTGEFLEKLLFSLLKCHRLLSYPKSLITYDYILTNLDIAKYQIEKKYIKKRIYYALLKLQKRGYITIDKGKKEEFFITFTEKGRFFLKFKKLQDGELKYKKIKKGKRILFFDIPEILKLKRDMLRFFIRLMGYTEIQKSVFFSEYDNYEDLKWIIKYLDVEEYIKIGIFSEESLK